MHSIAVSSGPQAHPGFSQQALLEAAERFREPTFVIQERATGRIGVVHDVSVATDGSGAYTLLASLPPSYPEWLGDRTFGEAHGVRYPYVAGAMANGIASTRLVIAMARGGFLSFFGAAGLSLARVEAAITELKAQLGDSRPWGANLIHSPNEPALENAVADLYIRRGVRRVSAAAYMALTPAIVRYAATGLTRDARGRVHRSNHVFAKISRPETALHFLQPAPEHLLAGLVAEGLLTPSEAELALALPVAEDITVESDSGGHTDNRPLAALLPTIARLRDQVQAERAYVRPIRVGAAGGLGSPAAVASAFAMGAAYVLTGSVNQAAVESGLHVSGKEMLATAGLADVAMAPAADMFEMGVEVQVLKRGTMFAPRARKLYDIYRAHSRWQDVPPDDQRKVERDILRATFDEAWASTHDFWSQRDPSEIVAAEASPHHKMALVFRAYLGLSSRWAIAGELDRRTDFQIWCGPAMGAFNAWTAGTFLAEPRNRRVVQVANNLLEGAAAITRAQQLRSFGVPMPAAAFDFRPRPLA